MIVDLTDKETRYIPAIGICEICGKETNQMYRTYFRYGKTKCKCHRPYHFDLFDHCKDCEPKTPKTTRINLPGGNPNFTSYVTAIVKQSRYEKLKRILNG